MGADRSETKQVDYAFSENGNVSFHTSDLANYLYYLNAYLAELDELLSDGGVSGIDHVDHIEDIEYSCGMLGELLGYSKGAGSMALDLIDQPLYKGFNHYATETLSRINIDDFSIDNNLAITHIISNASMPHEVLKDSLKLEDFIGLTSFGFQGRLQTVPEEFGQFTEIYVDFYEKYKDSMTDEEGNLIGLEDYLNMLAESGEFSHRMNKPLESFASNLMDMLILPAIYEAITGYELFTGEDLSGLDRGLKVAGALVSALSYGMSLSHMCSSLGGITRDKLIAAGFKEITSTTATYWVGYTCDELGLPVPVCIVVATIAGSGVDTFLDPILFDGLDSYHVSNAPEAKKPEENFVYQDMDLNLTYEPGNTLEYVANTEPLRIDEITVEFVLKPRYDEVEFARQLADQQAGMNMLTVQEYLDNRARFISEGRAPEANAAQQAARETAYWARVEALFEDGLSFAEAREQALEWLSTQAALHSPDQIAGGFPDRISGLGDKNINSSIGSQWRSRISAVDIHVLEMVENMDPLDYDSTYLNVILTYRGE